MSAPASAGSCPRPREVEVREERYLLPCGARDCPVCGARWSQDQRVRAVAAAEWLQGGVALITVTAPGDEYFGRRHEVSPSNRRARITWWNRDARRQFRRLHLAAMRPLRRCIRDAGISFRMLYRSWEYQKRGLLHAHVVMPAHTPLHVSLCEAYVFNLVHLADRFGFGYVLGGERQQRPRRGVVPSVPVVGADAAARYVCKYVASIGHGKGSMATVAKRTAKRGSVLYVDRRLTDASGVTMTTLRARRRVWARHGVTCTARGRWRAACVLDAMQRGRPPFAPGVEDGVRDLLSRVDEVQVMDGATGEVVVPTRAPVPVAVPLGEHGPTREPRLWAATLASVRLGDPERPELGPWRTVLTMREVRRP